MKVLIVDDDVNVRELLIEICKHDLKLEVVSAENGEQGLSLFDDSIDVVISDYSMPKMNGHDLLTKIHKKNSFIPLFLISGYCDKETLNHYIYTYIHKPFYINEFITLISSSLMKTN